jgi:hypothetical protein
VQRWDFGKRWSVALESSSCYDELMPASTMKRKPKNEAQILGDATDRLLRAVKEKMQRENGKVDYEALSKEGYSAAMIARLKEL